MCGSVHSCLGTLWRGWARKELNPPCSTQRLITLPLHHGHPGGPGQLVRSVSGKIKLLDDTEMMHCGTEHCRVCRIRITTEPHKADCHLHNCEIKHIYWWSIHRLNSLLALRSSCYSSFSPLQLPALQLHSESVFLIFLSLPTWQWNTCLSINSSVCLSSVSACQMYSWVALIFFSHFECPVWLISISFQAFFSLMSFRSLWYWNLFRAALKPLCIILNSEGVHPVGLRNHIQTCWKSAENLVSLKLIWGCVEGTCTYLFMFPSTRLGFVFPITIPSSHNNVYNRATFKTN